jgi:hypothetical protein
LGSTFFHIFSGQRPFEVANAVEMLQTIAHETAPRLIDAAPHLPTPLAVVISRMMARSPDERYQDVGVVLEDLASYEARKLLLSADAGAFVPLLAQRDPSSIASNDTQAYEPSAGSDG